MLINALIPGLLIAIVTMLGNYAANRKQIKRDNLRAAKKEAYETFFLPFISLMYSESIWDLNFSEFPEKTQVEFYRLIMKNIRYMNDEILDWVDIFHDHLVGKLIGDKTGDYGTLTPERLNEVFDSLAEEVLRYAACLADDLYQPMLGEHAMKLYLGNLPDKKSGVAARIRRFVRRCKR